MSNYSQEREHCHCAAQVASGMFIYIAEGLATSLSHVLCSCDQAEVRIMLVHPKSDHTVYFRNQRG